MALSWEILRSLSSNEIQEISSDVAPSAQYSAFVDDLETVGWLFANHEIKLGPSRVQKPVVDILVSVQPTKSKSQ